MSTPALPVHVARWLGVALAAFALAPLVACGGGKNQVEQVGPLITRGAIEALASYAFTTELAFSSEDGDFAASFDGVLQSPSRIQGRLTLSGSLSESLGRPPETEVIVIPPNAWWRRPGGEWQAGIDSPDSLDPLVEFAWYATPDFYLRALQFDSLALPPNDYSEKVNGMDAFPVRLDKPAVIELMSKGTAISLYPDEDSGPIVPGILDNARQVLPEDFLVETWIAKDGGYPVRIVFTYTCGSSCALSFGPGRDQTLRLQMDITDPHSAATVDAPF